ncbi:MULTISPECIES: 4Fe-4S binding protein [unclassified Ruegeria]|uniref:4Fe-4S binding protein n=1 Tax=unclassified Ruegeria TaxID=2625375 RepID=UPI001FFE1417|nr:MULTISPECIES: 4Fe-4S binding protein [unclassified Ruegeria]
MILLMLGSLMAAAEPLPRERIETFIRAPFSLGERLSENGVYSLLNSGGIEAGYVFETEPLAPLPGFSGAPINVLVVLDLEGRFMDVQLIEHNEPIFVSGLGQAPFHKFFEQYGGLSISDSIVVGTPYGDAASGSQLVYLDGVTKATASVRIAHESVMGAALAVAREKMQGLATAPPAFPNPDYDETLSWEDLVAKGIATNKIIKNSDVDALFEGTLWEDDDPEAQDYPDEAYLDLWVVDLGPKSIARAALSQDSFDELQGFLEISDNDEPILLIETARHGLVSDKFVRNTAPDWISAEQDGLPVALRDADLLVELADGMPDGVAMILRTDRRLGFDPSREWVLKVLAVREHGMFQPETGSVTLEVRHVTPDRFFERPVQITPAPPWLEALRNRQTDMIILSALLAGLVLTLGLRMNSFAAQPLFTPYRLAILAVIVGFIGWWGQGQLSIVTVLGVIRTAIDGGSYGFLLYDPFSLLIWAVSIAGLIAWGRGLFCGWLCPFGALQEFAHHLGKALRLPQIEPSRAWDQRLKWLKYVILGGLIGVVFLAPDEVDKVAEVEPFKTAITTFFIREWYYAAYAIFWLILGMVMFKGFCRYVCPLGAVMAIGGLLRGRDWIERRAECGSPCQLCKVKCKYGAIKQTGEIQYNECFQCLDCVAIHDDRNQCVPLILAARRQSRKVAAE